MGKLIAIEGLDGSGKSTQSALLCSSVEKCGLDPIPLSFPDYGSRGAEPVKMYLEGKLGDSPGDTGAYAASIFFAADRYINFRTQWKEKFENPSAVAIANRYTTANAYHQMSKLPEDSWEDFLSWLWELEFEKLSLPRPDGVILLSLPVETSSILVDKRSRATGAAKDIHETDTEYLSKCRKAAMYAAERLSWNVIECGDGNGGILPANEIHSMVCSAAGEILGVNLPL